MFCGIIHTILPVYLYNIAAHPLPFFPFRVNLENFGDTRQTRFGFVYSGSINNPVFKNIYAPVDGFVTNSDI